ncbi:MAG: TolC family protein, partial [Tepidisphaeraceae bacterium]
MIARYTLLSLIALAVTLAGCSSAGSSRGGDDDDFANVRHAVAERGGHRVHWNRGSTADADAAAAVRQLLAQPLSADAAVQVALLNNPALQAAYEDVGVAQAELVGAGLLSNPVFDAEARFGEGGSGTSVEITVVQDFLDVFQIPLRKRLATDALRSAELRTADGVLNLAAETRETYYAAQAATQLLELRKTVAEASGASADVATRLREAGNVTELDHVSERAMHETTMLDLTTAQAAADQARQRLGMLMG